MKTYRDDWVREDGTNWFSEPENPTTNDLIRGIFRTTMHGVVDLLNLESVGADDETKREWTHKREDEFLKRFLDLLAKLEEEQRKI